MPPYLSSYRMPPACSLENTQVFVWLKPSISGCDSGQQACALPFWFRIVTCPPPKNRPHRPGPPYPTHTPWLRSFSSFSTFSSPYTSRRSDFKTLPPPWTFIPNSTEVSSSLLLNPTFFYVVQLPCTCWCTSFTYFPQYESLGVFLSATVENLQTQTLCFPCVLCLPWWVAKCMVMLSNVYKIQLRKSEVSF